ncbi:SprT family zinc-dependent metalloprotease [uncultured Paraglaciecola sp.]|uniref:SprT family zinc-dependent metalloprotease n=1 Tax=uncultured Paraglaciecola sp. TaxID=1765024 RepID=UPI0030D89CE9
MSFNSQQLVIQKVEQCIRHASFYFEKHFTLPKINFNQRGKIAGCARLQKNELHFNPVLLADNLDAFLKEVVPHEVCHLLAYQLFGKVRPHGKEWQGLMLKLYNVKGQTYHQMDVSKVAGQQFNYRCHCGIVKLSVRRHNKVIRGQQQYICRKCSTALTLGE